MSNFIYIPHGTYINIQAMKALQIKPAEYMFLMLIDGYQGKSTTGWAELGNGNNFRTMTLFMKELGNCCGIDRTTIDRLSVRMMKNGYLEIKKSGYKVTPKFWVLNGEGKNNTTDKVEDTPPSVAKGEKKHFYKDSPFMDFEYFKTFVLEAFPNETDLDVSHYYEAITVYFSTENTKAYTNWNVKITDWIKRQIKDGDVRRTTTPSVKTRTNEELIQDIRNHYAAVRKIERYDILTLTDKIPTEYLNEVKNYIKDSDEAEQRNILPKAAKEDIAVFKNAISEAGGLKKLFNTLISQLKQNTG